MTVLKKWRVSTKEGETIVEAEKLTLGSGGALVFFLRGGVSLSYSPGFWKVAEPVLGSERNVD